MIKTFDVADTEELLKKLQKLREACEEEMRYRAQLDQ